MFSVQLHIPFDSKLGQRLALLQHVVALSVVSAICSLPGGYDVNIGIVLFVRVLYLEINI
jgi:biotin--protein ligase